MTEWRLCVSLVCEGGFPIYDVSLQPPTERSPDRPMAVKVPALSHKHFCVRSERRGGVGKEART